MGPSILTSFGSIDEIREELKMETQAIKKKNSDLERTTRLPI